MGDMVGMAGINDERVYLRFLALLHLITDLAV